MRNEPRLFPALLRHWRTRRGQSQLDFALAADVSPRHVSFLETGRAQPSREMVLRLAGALSVPLRDQNELLRAAGFPNAFAEQADNVFDASIEQAITRMLAHQEPFPMLVLNRRYDVLRANSGATNLFGRMLGAHAETANGARPPPNPLNAFHALFDPQLLRPFVVEWERVARLLLSRLHRESLERGSDRDLIELLKSLFDHPGVPTDWQTPDLSVPSEPCLTLRMRDGATELAFLVTVTVFSAPQNVALEELRLENYFPLDDATAKACERACQTKR